MRNKEENIKFILNLPYEGVTTETVHGMEALVSYNFRMYYGPTKVTARMKQTTDLVDIKAYGLVVVRHLEFDQPIPENTSKKLQYQGYKVSDSFNVAILNKDFGFLTAQNYELNHLMHRLYKMDVMYSWDELYNAIRVEVASWGEPVVDVSGHLVYDDELRVVKRDPFAKAGRLALKRKLQAQRSPLKSIKDFFNDIGGNDGGKGVDM